MEKRRRLDFLVLLVISMLVVAASAAIYYAMFSKATTTIAAAPVYFAWGGDSTGVLTLGDNDTSASLSLDAYPNVTLIYEQAVNLTADAAREVRLRHVSISPDDGDSSVSNFTSVVFTLINSTGDVKGALTYTVTAATDTWNEPATPTSWEAIAALEEWTMKIEITAADTANGGVSSTITIAVDVR